MRLGSFRRESNRNAVLKPQVDNSQIAVKQRIFHVETRHLGYCRGNIMFRQANGDAVTQPQVPTTIRDTDISANAAGKRRRLRHHLNDGRASLFSTSANDQRQRGQAATIERRDRLAIQLDDAQFLLVLPDRERLALDDLHFNASRIDLADFHTLDPWKLGNTIARVLDAETDHRRPSVQPNLLQDVNFGRFEIACDVDILDREAGARGDELNRIIPMAALNAAIDEHEAEQSARRNGRAKAR